MRYLAYVMSGEKRTYDYFEYLLQHNEAYAE